MSTSPPSAHLAVALDGAGWHPAAWREPDARPAELFSGRYWADLVAEAERGLLDLVTIDDAFSLQSSTPGVPDTRTDQVRGRLDAVLVAARVAPLTRNVGLVPTAIVTHTEPFHLSKAIATLDYASTGRAGVQIRVSARPDEAAHVGRHALPPSVAEEMRVRGASSPSVQALMRDLFDEAGDHVEVIRRLWDSWEDDAEIRDVASGRFIDRDKLHYIDFEGRWFSVRGPSITPRPPQGQPIVTALAHQRVAFQLVGRHADVGFVTPTDGEDARRILAEIRAAQAVAGRDETAVRVLGDLVVVLDSDATTAAARKDRLDERAGQPLVSDARIVTGTAAQLADVVEELLGAGLSGVRLRPAAIPHDLLQITRRLVPELQRRGLFRRAYEADTLRGLLGMSRPANRYAAA